MTNEQLRSYRISRERHGLTAAIAYHYAMKRPIPDSLTQCNWPTRIPGVFCESIMSYAEMCSRKPQLYFRIARSGQKKAS